ncbi:hypothetical protein F511_22176 [Dorcoceras hygrometricum]|uniref:Uncharacterized protein n=1 Tax=Dorcoceras hygrometricum TaxID=472368 RepID=A0A2Z7ALC1_9LAMI|nr:hypothetical protein F511_22176 [Dorcoceras hygrometricum]
MAASLIQNALQINFDSVLSLYDEGMVSMFKTLESSGLCVFLGCSTDIYEQDFVNFFDNAFVRGDLVISSVQVMFVEISEELFAGSFELLSEGMTSVTELPKDLINETSKDFSPSGEPIKTSCKKKEMKIEIQLLNDILSKTVIAKAGSFDAVTHDIFLLTTAIYGGIKNQLEQISVRHSEGHGDSLFKASPRVLNVKTIGTYIAKNKSLPTTAEKVAEEPMVDTVVRTVAKRRPAPNVEPVAKKKMTTVGRAAPTVKDFSIVPVVTEAEPISIFSAESPTVQRRQATKRKLILQEETDDEETDKEEKSDEVTEKEELEKDKEEKDEETEKEAKDKEKEVEKEKDVEATDSEDTETLSKVLKLTATSMSDEESLPIDEILKQIPEDMMLPSISAEEPTLIKFGRGITFKEVDWYKATLPSIDPAAKGKEPLVEEIKGNPAKEIFALISANIDFLVQIRNVVIEENVSFFQYSQPISIERRLYITAKYREMLIRKFLEASHNNFESSTRTSAIDLQVLDMLSDAHRLALIKLVEQLRLHKLEWTRPSTSNMFGGAVDRSRNIHSQFYSNVSSTSWVRSLIFIDESWQVVEGANPKPARLTRTFISIQKKPLPQRTFVDAFAQSAFSSNQSRTSILEDLTLRLFRGIGRKFVQMLFSFHFLDIFNQRTRERIEELKSELSQKITKLELAFAQSTSRQDMVFRAKINDVRKEVHELELAFAQSTSRQDMVFRAKINDVRKEVHVQKAFLSQEFTSFCLETWEGLNTLRAQLSEIITYINRGCDDKKGEESSRGPQPEDRSRPGVCGSGGSRSEPPSKRGSGSYRGRGSKSSGFSQWFS